MTMANTSTTSNLVGTLPPEGKGFPSVLSGAGMRSGRTLNHEMSGSEMGTSSVQSPSYKSLMRSKSKKIQKKRSMMILKIYTKVKFQRVELQFYRLKELEEHPIKNLQVI